MAQLPKSEVIARLLNPGIIAVIRTDRAEAVLPACEALIAGGVIALEITMTTPGALDAIRAAAQKFPQAAVGVGSVINAEMCRATIQAGAQFVVSPIMKPEIAAAAAKAADRPVMLGAYTPTEVQAAYEAGADFIKIFPADGLGPNHIKALLAPLPHLKIVPTGGVDLKTAPDFLSAGCVALGCGSSLIQAKILRENNWSELTRLAKEFVELAQRCRKK